MWFFINMHSMMHIPKVLICWEYCWLFIEIDCSDCLKVKQAQGECCQKTFWICCIHHADLRVQWTRWITESYTLLSLAHSEPAHVLTWVRECVRMAVSEYLWVRELYSVRAHTGRAATYQGRKTKVRVYSRSMWLTWRCWTAGRTPGRRAARGSRCWRGWLVQETGPQRWSWAGSKVRGWARRTKNCSRSCRGWRTLHGSPGSPCCCSASCTGTGEKPKGEENEAGEKGGSRKTRGRTQVKVPERQGFGGLRKVGLQWKQICVNTVCDDASRRPWKVHDVKNLQPCRHLNFVCKWVAVAVRSPTVSLRAIWGRL